MEGLLFVGSVDAFFAAFVWAGAVVRTGRALPLLFFGGIAIFVVVALFSLMTGLYVTLTEHRFDGHLAGAISVAFGVTLAVRGRVMMSAGRGRVIQVG